MFMSRVRGLTYMERKVAVGLSGKCLKPCASPEFSQEQKSWVTRNRRGALGRGLGSKQGDQGSNLPFSPGKSLFFLVDGLTVLKQLL